MRYWIGTIWSRHVRCWPNSSPAIPQQVRSRIWLSAVPSQYGCLSQFKARCRVCRRKGCQTSAPDDGGKARAAAIRTNKGDEVSEDRIQSFLIEHDAKAARDDVAA